MNINKYTLKVSTLNLKLDSRPEAVKSDVRDKGFYCDDKLPTWGWLMMGNFSHWAIEQNGGTSTFQCDVKYALHTTIALFPLTSPDNGTFVWNQQKCHTRNTALQGRLDSTRVVLREAPSFSPILETWMFLISNGNFSFSFLFFFFCWGKDQ